MNTSSNKICCLCGAKIKDFYDENNPCPLVEEPDAVCCSICNETRVLPTRIARLSFNSEGEN